MYMQMYSVDTNKQIANGSQTGNKTKWTVPSTILAILSCACAYMQKYCWLVSQTGIILYILLCSKQSYVSSNPCRGKREFSFYTMPLYAWFCRTYNAHMYIVCISSSICSSDTNCDTRKHTCTCVQHMYYVCNWRTASAWNRMEGLNGI